MTDSAAALPVKPLPKIVQRVVLLVMVAGVAGVFYWMRPSGECTTKNFVERGAGTACELEGVVSLTSERSKATNPLELSGETLDQFFLTDRAGRALIYLPPSRGAAPAEGARVRVRARVMKRSGSDILRLVASDVDLVK